MDVKEIAAESQAYESPEIVEVGEFAELTLGLSTEVFEWTSWLSI